MIDQVLDYVRVWKLVAPDVGDVLNAVYPSYAQACVALSDRQANGEAFPGEEVVRVQVALWMSLGTLQVGVVN